VLPEVLRSTPDLALAIAGCGVRTILRTGM
jgi:hypothetical protein